MRAVHGQLPAIAQLLIDAGADVKKANYYGVTALYIAARAGDPVATPHAARGRAPMRTRRCPPARPC